MTGISPLVCIIDDESTVRTLTSQIVSAAGFRVSAFGSAEEFFRSVDPTEADCVVTDLRMPGVDGKQLFHRLHAADKQLSVVFLTGYADIRTAVRLMQDGALTLLEKPYDVIELTDTVGQAVRRTRQLRGRSAAAAEARRRLAQLDSDERDVLECIMTGLPNKAIVARLQISPRTLDRRKQSIFQKLGVESVSELARLVTLVEGSE